MSGWKRSGSLRVGRLVLRATFAVVAAMAPTRAEAGEVGYSAIDLATVRIFALVGVGTTDVRSTDTNRPYTLAAPLAGHGSGLLISADGLILTARHVVEHARQLAVVVPGEETPVPASVVYVDDREDFAFVSIGGNHNAFAKLPVAPPSLHVRQSVFAVGYPIDPSKKHPQSTKGVISGTEDPHAYTLGISINPGNSGGALVDENEKVLGVVVARGKLENGIEGIGIAVALDRPLAVLPKVLERNARARTALGSLPEADRAAARVIGGLVEGEGLYKMLSDAKRALTHLKQSALSRDITAALASAQADADLLVLGCAYHWNAAVVHRILEEPGWQAELKTSEQYCVRAAKRDPDVIARSPLVKFVAPADQSYRLENTQAPTPGPSKAPKAPAPPGVAGFAFGTDVAEASRVCKDAKFSFTGVKKEGLRCSGAPGGVGYTAVVRLRYCENELCKIDVIQKLEGDDPSAFLDQYGRRQRDLEAAYGPAVRAIHRLRPECTESLAWCLSNGKAQLEQGWVWPTERTGVVLRMERVDGRPIIKLTYERRSLLSN